MADIFISYTSTDDRIARFVHDHLAAEGVGVFLAPVSILPGERWSPTVLSSLNAAKWVIFLASREAIGSSYVQQELGAAIAASKQLIPVVWNISPSELPGWVGQYQALDLRDKTMPQAQQAMAEIAKRVKDDKARGLLILGIIGAAILAFGK